MFRNMPGMLRLMGRRISECSKETFYQVGQTLMLTLFAIGLQRIEGEYRVTILWYPERFIDQGCAIRSKCAFLADFFSNTLGRFQHGIEGILSQKACLAHL